VAAVLVPITVAQVLVIAVQVPITEVQVPITVAQVLVIAVLVPIIAVLVPIIAVLVPIIVVLVRIIVVLLHTPRVAAGLPQVVIVGLRNSKGGLQICSVSLQNSAARAVPAVARKDSVRQLAIPEVHKLVVLWLVAPKVAVPNRVAALVDLQDALVSCRLRGMCAAVLKAPAHVAPKASAHRCATAIAVARKQVLPVVKVVVRKVVATMIAAVPKLVRRVVQAPDVVRKDVVGKVVALTATAAPMVVAPVATVVRLRVAVAMTT